MVDDKEDEDNENSTEDEEFVCVNDENDVIILEFSVIVVENITHGYNKKLNSKFIAGFEKLVREK